MTVADPPVETPTPNDPGEVEQQRRRCSRCLQTFSCEAGLDPRVQRGWWLCPPCAAQLTPSRTTGEDRP